MSSSYTMPRPATGPTPPPIPTDLLIGGEWREAAAKKRTDVFNPSNGELLTTIANCDIDDALAAVTAAQKAAPGWAATSPRARSEILRKCHEVMVANVDWL